jgi:hypothetical protein
MIERIRDWRQTLSWKLGHGHAKKGRSYSCPWWVDETVYALAGTLDDPSVFVPTAEVFCDYAFSWLYDGGERPHLPRGFG